MAVWVGLIGVLAGALIALGGQYLMQRDARQDRNTTLLLEQCAVIVALSYDFRNRVFEERNQLANDAVVNWDIGTYRLAEARLRILAPEPLVTALMAVREAGVALGVAWRLSPADEPAIEGLWAAHKDAIGQFTTASSRVTQGHSGPRWRTGRA